MVVLSQAQNINWRSIQDHKNVASVNLGLDFGTTVQVMYYRQVSAFRPILLGGDFSIPFGETLLDDFKVRWGGQIEVFEYNGFSVTGKVLANFRRYENDLVRMASFGSEFALISGYYRPTWHVGFEVGFDKSIITHLKHSDVMRDYVYADIQDGWYIPSGGNWFYGLHGSKTVGSSTELTGRFGFTNAERKDEDAMFPVYLQLGFNKKF